MNVFWCQLSFVLLPCLNTVTLNVKRTRGGTIVTHLCSFCSSWGSYLPPHRPVRRGAAGERRRGRGTRAFPLSQAWREEKSCRKPLNTFLFFLSPVRMAPAEGQGQRAPPASCSSTDWQQGKKQPVIGNFSKTDRKYALLSSLHEIVDVLIAGSETRGAISDFVWGGER